MRVTARMKAALASAAGVSEARLACEFAAAALDAALPMVDLWAPVLLDVGADDSALRVRLA